MNILDGVATVQAYRHVEINLLANDGLSSGVTDTLRGDRLLRSVLKPSALYGPHSGTLMRGSSDGTPVYLNTGTGSLTGCTDSFRYAVSPGESQPPDTATVYILHTEDRHGTPAGYGMPYTALLDTLPAGATDFCWYTGTSPSDTVFQASGPSYTFGPVKADSVRMVKLLVPDDDSPWNLAGGFPAGEFTVHVPAAGTTESMR